MIPFNLKEKGTAKFKFNLPESWKELTLKQLIQWHAEAKKESFSLCKQLEILTGIAESDWFNCQILSLDTILLPHLEWIKEPIDIGAFSTLPVPDAVTIAGKVIQVPKDIDLKTFGQKITFQTEMAKYFEKDGEEITGFKAEFFPIAIAIYLYPEEKFEDSKAFAFAKEVESLKLTEAYPLATFFLLKFLGSLNGIENSSTMNRMSRSSVQV